MTSVGVIILHHCNHPTSQCTKQEQPAQRAPRTNKWCNFCQLWTNHETQECYYRIRFMREQAGNQQPAAAPQQPQYVRRGGNQNYVAQGGERAQPVLGNQPPLPGAAPVRLLRADEYAPDGTMVPVEYYVENTESSLALAPTTQGYTEEPLPTVEGHYQMDHNTLWFIANGGARQVGPAPRPYRPAQPAAVPPGPCYRCGGDHWIRDCPLPLLKMTNLRDLCCLHCRDFVSIVESSIWFQTVHRDLRLSHQSPLTMLR